jgi:hypothetical protein
MNLDAIFSFVVALVSAVGSLFVNDPNVSNVLREVSTVLSMLGTAFHLDGK